METWSTRSGTPSPATVEHLDDAIDKACSHLLSLQHGEGYWIFDLEADVTIPSEYVILQRFLDREISLSLTLWGWYRRVDRPAGIGGPKTV